VQKLAQIDTVDFAPTRAQTLVFSKSDFLIFAFWFTGNFF